VGFKPTIAAGERPQTYALDRAVTGIAVFNFASYPYGMRSDVKTNTALTEEPSRTRNFIRCCTPVGWYRIDGIATRYGLDSPRIESRWRRDYPHPSRPDLGPTQPPIQMVLGLPGGKVAWVWS